MYDNKNSNTNNKNGNYSNNKNYQNKNNNYQNKSFDKPKFTAEFIEKGFRNDKGKLRPDLFSDEAKNIALQLARETTSSQLRSFYGEVKALQNRMEDEEESFEDILPFILMLKSKADYKYRNGKNQKIPQVFRDFIFAGVDEIKKINTKQGFDDFCYMFEAVVGFIYGINGGK